MVIRKDPPLNFQRRTRLYHVYWLWKIKRCCAHDGRQDGISTRNTIHWENLFPLQKMVEKFTERHKLSLKRAQSFGKSRTSFTEDTLKTFYDNVYKMMTENEYGYNFLESSHLIFNCDETGGKLSGGKLIISVKGMLYFIRHVPKSLNNNICVNRFLVLLLALFERFLREDTSSCNG